jgi:methylamine dehydrogenase accessory protein MauD
MNFSDVSYVILWTLQVVMAVAILSLARQVGLLHLRVRPLGAGSPERGPKPGQVVDFDHLTSLLGREVRLSESRRSTLLVFASQTCSVCRGVMPGVQRLATTEADRMAVLVAIDDASEAGLEYLRSYGFDDGIPSAQVRSVDAGHRPFAALLAPDQTVLAIGIVNTLEQLEELIAAGEAFSLSSAEPTAIPLASAPIGLSHQPQGGGDEP